MILGRRRFLVAVAALAMVVGGCGSEPAGTARSAGEVTTSQGEPDPGTESPFWVARDNLPDGYRALTMDEYDRRSVIYYGPLDEGDVYDADLRVVLAPEDLHAQWDDKDRERVEVNGHDAFVVPLFDDGRTYGVAVTWEIVPGHWVAVEGPEPTTREQVLAVAEGLESLDEEEWERFREGLSQHGEPGPDATEVDAVTGSLGDRRWAMTVLVPRDYPLGPDDRRVNCYRLTIAGTSTKDDCDSLHWDRVSGQIFVFGAAPADVAKVVVRPYMDDGEDITASTATIEVGPPSSFFAVPLSDEACFVTVARADGGEGESIGTIGPLPSQEDHPRCTERIHEWERRQGRS